MAIIYSYPVNAMLEGSDVLAGTSTKVINGKASNATKSFTLSSLATFVESTLPTPIEGWTGVFRTNGRPTPGPEPTAGLYDITITNGIIVAFNLVG